MSYEPLSLGLGMSLHSEQTTVYVVLPPSLSSPPSPPTQHKRLGDWDFSASMSFVAEVQTRLTKYHLKSHAYFLRPVSEEFHSLHIS